MLLSPIYATNPNAPDHPIIKLRAAIGDASIGETISPQSAARMAKFDTLPQPIRLAVYEHGRAATAIRAWESTRSIAYTLEAIRQARAAIRARTSICIYTPPKVKKHQRLSDADLLSL